jgi:uncharacterized membrane protein
MVHFPIALLFAAPVLLLASLFAWKSWRAWAGASLVLMVLGSVALWLAAGSGHAAGQLVEKTIVLERAIGAHEALGVTTRNLFTIVTLLFAGLLLVPGIIRKPLPVAVRTSLHAAFLLAYLACTMVLANAASQGGRLVHESGVRAMVVPPSQPAATLASETGAAGVR